MANEQKEHGRGSAQSGLGRLMLARPSFCQQWQAQTGSTSWTLLQELFESYDEACLALEAFRLEHNHPLVAEYESVCAELEADIVREMGR